MFLKSLVSVGVGVISIYLASVVHATQQCIDQIGTVHRVVLLPDCCSSLKTSTIRHTPRDAVTPPRCRRATRLRRCKAPASTTLHSLFSGHWRQRCMSLVECLAPTLLVFLPIELDGKFANDSGVSFSFSVCISVIEHHFQSRGQ